MSNQISLHAALVSKCSSKFLAAKSGGSRDVILDGMSMCKSWHSAITQRLDEMWVKRISVWYVKVLRYVMLETTLEESTLLFRQSFAYRSI